MAAVKNSSKSLRWAEWCSANASSFGCPRKLIQLAVGASKSAAWQIADENKD
jgi:hypothetical protein